MCTGRCQFRKPAAVERNQGAENIRGQAPVIFRTSVLPYAQRRLTWHHRHRTAEMGEGFCFESTDESLIGVVDPTGIQDLGLPKRVTCPNHPRDAEL